MASEEVSQPTIFDNKRNAKADIKRTFIGHKDRIFHIATASDGRSFISSSEDGTCKIWDVATRKCTATLPHNREAEALRAVFLLQDTHTICTAGSDGKVGIWLHATAVNDSSGSNSTTSEPISYRRIASLDHGKDAQIYACESIESSGGSQGELLTAADNRIFIWDVNRTEQPVAVYDFHRIHQSIIPNENKLNNNYSDSYQRNADAVFEGKDVSQRPFGGARNPQDLVFVFDAKASPAHSNVIGAAMSDATIRFVDVRQRLQPVQYSLDLGGTAGYSHSGVGQVKKLGHATSLSWSDDSSSLLVALGCGRIAVLDTRMNRLRLLLQGHASPCYGAIFTPPQQQLQQQQCISWSSDRSVRFWDIHTGHLIRSVVLNNYPVLHAAWSPIAATCSSSNDSRSIDISSDNSSVNSSVASHHLLCGGGGGEASAAFAGSKGAAFGSFIGVPIYEISASVD